jgi:hypothetical protein
MSTQPTQADSGLLDVPLALSQIGDEEAMNEMLLMLHESLARDVPQISDLLEEGDMVGANRLLHAIKGFIPIFCPESFCAVVVEVEGLSKDTSSSALAPAYAALRPQLERLQADVAVYLAAHHTSV